MIRSTTDIANELLAENAAIKAQLAAEEAHAKEGWRVAHEVGTECDQLKSQLAHRDAQIAALTAENLDLKHPGTYLPSKRETPATDAAANAMRAEGVDRAIEHLHKKFEGTGRIGVPVMALQSLAQQLREGK